MILWNNESATGSECGVIISQAPRPLPHRNNNNATEPVLPFCPMSSFPPLLRPFTSLKKNTAHKGLKNVWISLHLGIWGSTYSTVSSHGYERSCSELFSRYACSDSNAESTSWVAQLGSISLCRNYIRPGHAPMRVTVQIFLCPLSPRQSVKFSSFSPQTSVGVVLREKPGCSRLHLVSSLYWVGHLFWVTWKVLLNGLVNIFSLLL